MMRHHDFVAAFAASLRDGVPPPGMTAGRPEETARRLAVYRNNVAVSLTEALRAHFPVVAQLVGDACFAALARLFAAGRLPPSPVLAEWGETFPAFLEGLPALADYPYLADVARIEHARLQAFHAADAPAIDPARLGEADPGRLRLHLHPSVTLLRLAHPAVSIWAAHQPGAARSPIPPGPETALILRERSLAISVRRLGPGDAALIGELRQGKPLLAAAAAARAADPAHDPRPCLLQLMTAGALVEGTVA